ncbi:Similar to ZNF384: Zinc finger protein 384 (Homo sapiens) [Cotesia congregata]|uniref:Similar to ZNF384: Zinc finger protein 384 (Homo sapiens) n=1 Tax=Cotesia congregata TaxID=51543 RepID=A0A8J2HJ47_COTCN|nr:Similar to ZNF384: Zinc finger protein 384 (Homo sapiens) [Cotesia congregata]
MTVMVIPGSVIFRRVTEAPVLAPGNPLRNIQLREALSLPQVREVLPEQRLSQAPSSRRVWEAAAVHLQHLREGVQAEGQFPAAQRYYPRSSFFPGALILLKSELEAEEEEEEEPRSPEPLMIVDTSEALPAEPDSFDNDNAFDPPIEENGEEDDLTMNLQKITAILDPQDPLETPGSCLDDIANLEYEDELADPDDPSTSESRRRRIKKHACPQCDRKYTNKSTLNRHLREECGKKPQYTCRYCHKSFKQRSNFQRHIWTIHGCLLTTIA